MSLLLRDSVSIDEDHRFVTNEIENCIRSDQNVTGYFESALTIPIFYNIIAQTDNVATVSDVKSYPKIVYDAACSAKHRVFMGAFDELSKLYAVVDSVLYIWPFSNPSNIETIKTDGNIITAVTSGVPEQKVYNKNVTHVIVIATDRNIMIIPVGTLKSFTDRASKLKTSTIFVTTFISTKGEIFLCSDYREVFLVKYKETKKYEEVPNLKLKPLTSPLSFLPYARLLFLPSMTKSMAVCETGQYVALLSAPNKIRFYQYSNEHLRYVSKEKTYDRTILNIEPVPISDSSSFNFVAFASNGDRIFFGTCPGSYRDPNEIHIRLTIPAPPQFQGHTLISGSFSHGVSVFTFKDMLAVLHPNHNPHRLQSVLTEDVIIITDKFQHADNLSFFRSDHIFRSIDSTLFKNELLWQHTCRPSSGFLQTADGFRIVNFKLPVDNLEDLLQGYKGTFTEPIRDWMLAHSQNGEACATTILLASRSPELHRWALHTMVQFTKMNSKRYERFSNNLSHASAGFLLRVERLLMPIWQQTLFTLIKKKSDSSKSKYVVNTIFKELPANTIENFRNIFKFGEDYIKVRRSSIEVDDPDLKKEIDEEATVICRMYTYISSIIETLKFIQIIRTLKTSVIDETIRIINEEARVRLTDIPFGGKVTPFEALREFAASLFSVKDGPSQGDRFSIRLAHECPFFFSEAASKIKQALEELDMAKSKLPKDAAPILERVIDTFVKYADHISLQNLNKIADVFANLHMYKAIVDIALTRAELIDPTHLALTWYKGERSRRQTHETTAFNKRYECYLPLLKLCHIPEAFDVMLNNDDETFHVVLYSHILRKAIQKYKKSQINQEENDMEEEDFDEEINEDDNSQEKRLLSASTPYLEPFLQENCPDVLYLYNASHQDYATAAARLKILALDDRSNTEISVRLDYLRKMATYAKASRMMTIYTEAVDLVHAAEIQIQLLNELPKDHQLQSYRAKLMKAQDLFDRCVEYQKWSMILKLLPYLSVDGNKKNLVSVIWSNFFIQQSGTELRELARMISSIARSAADGTKEIIDPSILMPILEDTKLAQGGQKLWAVKLLHEIGVPINNLLEVYNTFLGNTEITDGQRAIFIDCVKYLTDNGAQLVAGRKANYVLE